MDAWSGPLTFGIIAAAIVGSLTVCAGPVPRDEASAGTSGSTGSPPGDPLTAPRPLTDTTFAATPARLERGRYLAEGVLMCMLCHTERDTTLPGAPPIEARGGSGRVVWEDDEGHVLPAPNLTPDSATGTGAWPDDALARAIREGVGHDGRALSRPMYWRSFRSLSDEDLAAVIVYLRSLPAVRNPLPARSLPSDWLEAIADDPKPLTVPVAMPDLSDPVARGTYLIALGDCVGCHTSWYTDTQPGAFGGGNTIGERDVFSTNITHDSSGIGGWGQQTFIDVMRTGKGGTLDPAMPWIAFGRLTDEDLAAIYQALGEAPRARHWISNAAPPTYCVVCGQQHGLGELNEPFAAHALDVDVSLLRTYEGRYADEEGDTVEVRLRDELLHVGGIADEEMFPMLVVSERSFFVPAWGEHFEFEPDRDGRATGYRSRHGLEIYTYERVAD